MMTSLAKQTIILRQKSLKTCKRTLKKQHCLSSPFFGKKGIWLYQLTATLQLWSLAWERRKEGKNDNLDATRYPSKRNLTFVSTGNGVAKHGLTVSYYCMYVAVPPWLLMLCGGLWFKKKHLLREIEFVFGLRVSFLYGEFFPLPFFAALYHFAISAFWSFMLQNFLRIISQIQRLQNQEVAAQLSWKFEIRFQSFKKKVVWYLLPTLIVK